MKGWISDSMQRREISHFVILLSEEVRRRNIYHSSYIGWPIFFVDEKFKQKMMMPSNPSCPSCFLRVNSLQGPFGWSNVPCYSVVDWIAKREIYLKAIEGNHNFGRKSRSADVLLSWQILEESIMSSWESSRDRKLLIYNSRGFFFFFFHKDSHQTILYCSSHHMNDL